MASPLAWRSTAELLGRALRALSTFAWAQTLDAREFGALSHAWTVNLVLAQAFGLGLHALLLREASADPDRARGYYASAMRLRLLLLVPELLVLVCLPFSPRAPYFLLFLGVSLSAAQDIASHLLMAQQRWREEAFANLAGSAAVAVISIVWIARGGGLAEAAASVALGNAVGLLFMLQKTQRAPAVPLHLSLIVPWAAAGLLEQASFHLEILWLERVTDAAEIAHFSAVLRVVALSAPLLLVSKQVVLPAATRGETLSGRALLVLFGAGLVASLALFLALPPLLPFLYGFADAHTTAVAQHLVWILPFWLLQTVLAQEAGGQRRMRLWIGASIATLAVQAALLVPVTDAVGAARAKVATAFLTALLFYSTRRKASAATARE